MYFRFAKLNSELPVGVDGSDDLGVLVETILQDNFRIQYHHDYLTYVIDSIRLVLKWIVNSNIAKIKIEVGGAGIRLLSLF